MHRLRRTAVTVSVILSLVGVLAWTGSAAATSLSWTQADVANAGWGDNPARVPNATWYTILVNRVTTPGHGRTIFVDLEMSTVRCDKGKNQLVTVSRGTVDNMAGHATDLQMTATSARYRGVVDLTETTRVSNDCALPGPPVITTRDLGPVTITADWTIGTRTLVHECTSYATPPPPTLSFAVGWRSDDVQASMTLSGGFTLSLGPGSQYTAHTQRTFTVDGIPAVRVPGTCVPG